MTLIDQRRQRLRMACKLQTCYQHRGPNFDPLLDDDRWQRLVRNVQRLSSSMAGDLDRMVAFLQPQVQSTLQQFGSELTTLAAEVARLDCHRDVPSLRLLYAELTSLEDEFETVELDLRQRQITVQTESIVLEEVDLGPFEIRLSLDRWHSHPPYAVVALEPNTPASSEGITHPHVQHGTLCEGEGRHAIHHALAQGRIGDFFLLVAQVLRTYNEGSAYCSLSAWNESPCADCGDLTDEDRQSLCDHCDRRLCDDCIRYCHACDASICGECSSFCDTCGDRPCGRCIRSCKDCGRSLCAECPIDELCPRCHDLQPENLHEPSEDPSLAVSSPSASPPQTAATAAGAAVQPVCLGEAAVLA